MQTKLKKLEKTTLQDQAYEELKDGLMKGHFLPGTVLTTRSLAKDMGTSIMPVRDAIQRLVAERGLIMLPNRTAQVPTTTLEEFNMLTRIRIRMEGLAAAQGALNATEEEIARIHTLNEDMRQAVRDMDSARVLECNTALHFTLYGASRSEFLVSIIETMWMRIGPLLLVPFRRTAEGDAIFESGSDFHKQIIEGLRARDPEKTETALASDIETAAEWYRQNNTLFKDHGIPD